MRGFVAFVFEEDGQDLLEYAFLAMFIAVVVVTAVKTIGTALNTQFSNVGSQLSGGS